MSSNLDLLSISVTFVYFTLGAYIAFSNVITTKLFQISNQSFANTFLQVVIMTTVLYKMYQVVQNEAEARAAANA